MSELTYHKAPKHEDYLIETAGHTFRWLAVEPGIHRCAGIEDGVALAHWNCEEPRGRGQAEGGWLISFADLEAFYLAAKAHRDAVSAGEPHDKG